MFLVFEPLPTAKVFIDNQSGLKSNGSSPTNPGREATKAGLSATLSVPSCCCGNVNRTETVAWTTQNTHVLTRKIACLWRYWLESRTMRLPRLTWTHSHMVKHHQSQGHVLKRKRSVAERSRVSRKLRRILLREERHVRCLYSSFVYHRPPTHLLGKFAHTFIEVLLRSSDNDIALVMSL